MSENSQTRQLFSVTFPYVKREEMYYKAMLARDHRFDGKFFVGVKTTGIYCRPICPAKPQFKNVEFFQSGMQAERAGYRPCLRCRPESAPQSPAWVGTSAVVQRALKALHGQTNFEFKENEFASQFGVSARHLRRLFIDEIGKTPKQIAFENRLNLSRKLIVETSLPLSEIAFASGFQSIRRFNDAFKDRFQKSPSKIRRSWAASGPGLTVSLPYRPPFDFEGLLHFYKAHKMGNLEFFEDHKMYRVIELNGEVGQLTISNDPKKSALKVHIDFPSVRLIHTIVSRVRSLFDLDSDPVLVANSLELDPKSKSILRKYPGIRLPSGWDPFEVAVSTILGQLVSVERGQALVGDLIELLGRDSGRILNRKVVKCFPRPHQVASGDLSSLKTTQTRREALKTFSKAVADGTISLEPTQDVDVFRNQLLSIRGIGPWTANYMALKVLRYTDSFPETDLILARALELHPKKVLAQMSPWRGYAAALFWREYSHQLKKRRVSNK